jgi:hypothetical protein
MRLLMHHKRRAVEYVINYKYYDKYSKIRTNYEKQNIKNTKIQRKIEGNRDKTTNRIVLVPKITALLALIVG